TVVLPPPQNPKRTEDAGGKKSCSPSELDGYPRNKERGENGADVCAGVEDACSQRALTLREPFSDCLDGSWKVPGFSDTEEKPREPELKRGIGERVPHSRETPHAHNEDVADARADFVNQTSGDQQADCIRGLECVDNVTVVDFSKADRVLKGGLE